MFYPSTSDVKAKQSPNNDLNSVWEEKKDAALNSVWEEKKESALQKDTEINIPTKTSSNDQDYRRYKNPILLVFAILNAAKGALREGLQETKKDNRLLEKNWEALSLKVSDEYKSAQERQQWWSKAYASPTGMLALQTLAQQALPTYGDNIKALGEKAGSGVQLLLQGANQTIQTELEKNKTPLDIRSQAANSLYQARVSDESSEKQSVDGVNRSIEELMRQEAQLFTGAIRGA